MERMGRPLFGGPEFVDIYRRLDSWIWKGNDLGLLVEFVELFDLGDEFFSENGW